MIEVILWIIFVGSAILLSVVILLQEAKGGGLAEAFGGMGAQTFGVKASGINKFTSYVAIVFVLTAVLITVVRKDQSIVADQFNTKTDSLPGVDGSVDPGATGGARGGSLDIGNPPTGTTKPIDSSNKPKQPIDSSNKPKQPIDSSNKPK